MRGTAGVRRGVLRYGVCVGEDGLAAAYVVKGLRWGGLRGALWGAAVRRAVGSCSAWARGAGRGVLRYGVRVGEDGLAAAYVVKGLRCGGLRGASWGAAVRRACRGRRTGCGVRGEGVAVRGTAGYVVGCCGTA
ncbi:hypothetical protein ACIA58_36395 [Kribbella sp. NPDC051586]|uniref:hypothetical protein n=1 Tax=Kribbella sp. NPDC051586 TaxID=3364118 RepID=UPI00378B1416